MVQWAVKRRVPLLGICRGMQVLNVGLGGTLYLNVADHVPGAEKHDWFPEEGYPRDLIAHEVRLAPEATARALVGAAAFAVNSIHHQSVRTLGEGLVATGFAPDGVVEAVQAPELPFCLGIQWHPEELLNIDARQGALFSGLVEAAARFRAGTERNEEPDAVHVAAAS